MDLPCLNKAAVAAATVATATVATAAAAATTTTTTSTTTTSQAHFRFGIQSTHGCYHARCVDGFLEIRVKPLE